MTPEEFLQQLNPLSRVFDLSIEYKYTEEQLVLFAKLYHESELKKLRVTDVSESVCYCGKPSVEECEPCCSLVCALKPKIYRQQTVH
jgi:hypothetical protein